MHLPKDHNRDSHEEKQNSRNYTQKRRLSHTRPRKRTIIALGLLRELGQVDITLSFLLCSHAGRFCSLVATRTRGRMQRRTLADKKRSIPLPQRCTNSADAGRATKRAQRKVQNGRQQSRSFFSVHPAAPTALPPCNLTALPPCHPATSFRQPGKKKKRGAVYTTTRHSTIGLSLSLIPSDWQYPCAKTKEDTRQFLLRGFLSLVRFHRST